ncbi:MAG: hypothetical protein P8Y47_12770 [Alphaproteobacteria bacterium]
MREIIRLTYTPINICYRSYTKPPASVILNIDDTLAERSVGSSPKYQSY